MLFLLAQAVFVGNPVCESCHRGVYRQYSQTPMARSTGRPGQWQIGSGTHARVALEQRGGFFYPSGGTTPVDPGCFDCHASNPRLVPGTLGKVGEPPFLQTGVSCERCHGPGGLHVNGSGRMVFPTALDSPQRDAICAQCHLIGEARIPRPGRNPARFTAGDTLSQYLTVFAAEGPPSGPVEQLAASRCKQKSPDLWCGTCHDVHQSKTDRGACLQCHTTAQCNRGPDCTACHMPKQKAYSLHKSLTDHTISRKPGVIQSVNGYRLRPLTLLDTFSKMQSVNPAPRDLGLAYAEAWNRRADQRQLAEAERLLSQVPNPTPEVQAWLGRFAEIKGETGRAASLYESALARQLNRMALERLPQLYLRLGMQQKAKAMQQRARSVAGIGGATQ